MSIEKDIFKLMEAKVIDESTAHKITEYYKGDSNKESNRLLVVFGVIGSILVGLGVILILAHNWDQLSRLMKIIISFTPLILSQILCAFVLFKPIYKPAWRESAAVLLFFGIGASIALISQVYHLPSDLSGFLLIWMTLAVPIIYVLDSRAVSMLFILGITWYAVNLGYFERPQMIPVFYWLLLAAVFPFYLKMASEQKKENFTRLHHWLIALSILICFNTVLLNKESQNVLMLITDMSALGIFYAIGRWSYFKNEKLRNNPFKVIGSLGTILILLFLSFDFYWEYLADDGFSDLANSSLIEELMAIVLTVICSILVLLNFKNRSKKSIAPIEFVFILFLIISCIGLYSPYAYILINVLLLTIAVLTILEGANQNHLGILNYGLLIIAVLIACRFFDSNLSFFVRGLLFVLIGVCFFLGNYWFLNKRKENAR